ncbi:MAG TPA: TonB-dependent receptor [Candidatus Kryptonia bacterium]|nr:TonB-dependent receptor [Candidatus Kryptonia bacterium]
MRCSKELAVAIVVIWTIAGSVAADERDEKPLGTVVVTATRSEQPIEQATTSIDVINADEIESKHADQVSDVLRDVPGVDVSQSGSPGTSAEVFIRGADADQTLVLIDGVEANSPTLGQFDFGTLNTDNVDRIEVLRGAGGTLYGSDAVGGVINVLTKRGEGPPRLSLLNEGGNGGTYRNRLSFSGAQGIVGVSGTVSYLTTGGFRPVNDDYTNLAGSLRVDADLLERGTLRGFFRYSDGTVGLFNNTNFLAVPDPNARFSDEFYVVKGEWEHRPFDSLTYRVAGSVFHDTETFTDPDAMPFFTQRSQIPTQTTTGEGQVTYLFGSVGVTTAGFEFKEKEARPKSSNVNAAGTGVDSQAFSASRSIYAGYLQQQILLLDDRLIGVAGFRVDGDQDFGREVSASWSVGYLQDWDGSGRWASRVKGGYAEGFRAPTFNELFFPGFGNPDLTAETSSEYDGGVVQQLWGEWLAVDSTYFNRRTRDLIQAAATCPGQVVMAGLLIACNVGRADVQGVETGLTLLPLAGLSLRGSYTYLDFHVIGAGGQPETLRRRPHNGMAATARYQHARVFRPDDQIDLTTSVNFVGERKDFAPTTFATVDNPSYTVTNAAATYSFDLPGTRLKRASVYARVGNLFDRNYQEVLGFKSPPIHFVAGASVTF